jgi:hypothetical protein
MKRRVVKTYKILAVAVTAAAGCTQVELSEAPAQVQSPAASPASGSFAQAAFHPLRDRDGYPLVGNMVRKGGQPPGPDAGSDAGDK